MIELFFRKTYREFSEFVISTENELIILSPYIKIEPLKLLIEKVKPGIKVIFVARWKLNDLIFGSSDIEVYEYLKSTGHDFYVNNKIHLKVLVKDKSEILIGSANITGSGLGLFENSNIEAIAVDILDKDYLPEIYSILRESILVDDNLVKNISEKIGIYKGAKDKQNEINDELDKIEKLIFIKSKMHVLVEDFLFTPSPDIFLNSIKSVNINDSVKHDLKVLGLVDINITKEFLAQSFLSSSSYLWQKENIKDSTLFGKYSELLHDALVDDPRPYRKQVKELVANMFSWTKEFSADFDIIQHNHTVSMKRK